MRAFVLTLAVAVMACSPRTYGALDSAISDFDGGIVVDDTGTITDASIDAGTIDAGTIDAGAIDAGAIDAGPIDASTDGSSPQPPPDGHGFSDPSFDTTSFYACSSSRTTPTAWLPLFVALVAMRRRRSTR